MSKDKLTTKQTMFIAEYTTNNGNGVRAARKAYYGINRTDDTYRAIASQNLTKPAVIKGLANIQAGLNARTAETIETIQQEHRRLQLLAEEKGDLAVATSNLAYRGKILGSYIDKQQVETSDVKQYTETEIDALKDVAAGYNRLLARAQTNLNKG